MVQHPSGQSSVVKRNESQTLTWVLSQASLRPLATTAIFKSWRADLRDPKAGPEHHRPFLLYYVPPRLASHGNIGLLLP